MSNIPESKLSAVRADSTETSPLLNIPDAISLDKWADTGFEWSGQVAPSSFERLLPTLSDEHEQLNLNIIVNLYRRNNVLHLTFTIMGSIWLTCQRCLQPISVNLSDEYDIALFEDESQIRLVGEDQDFLLLSEVMSNKTSETLLPLKALIEDEILLKTPLAPKHEDCEMSVEQVGDIPEEENENPFAALISLKGKLSN